MEDGTEGHALVLDCIKELRKAMLRQKEAAALFSFEISTRFLAALEGLAHDPGIGMLRYSVHNTDTGEKTELHPQHVQGVIINILAEYKKMGDWSPLREAKNQAADYAAIGRKLLAVVDRLLDVHKESVDPELRDTAERVSELARQLGVHLPGPDRW